MQAVLAFSGTRGSGRAACRPEWRCDRGGTDDQRPTGRGALCTQSARDKVFKRGQEKGGKSATVAPRLMRAGSGHWCGQWPFGGGSVAAEGLRGIYQEAVGIARVQPSGDANSCVNAPQAVATTTACMHAAHGVHAWGEGDVDVIANARRQYLS
jgi:hypothetical protein